MKIEKIMIYMQNGDKYVYMFEYNEKVFKEYYKIDVKFWEVIKKSGLREIYDYVQSNKYHTFNPEDMGVIHIECRKDSKSYSLWKNKKRIKKCRLPIAKLEFIHYKIKDIKYE
jgi:hypothetical protein